MPKTQTWHIAWMFPTDVGGVGYADKTLTVQGGLTALAITDLREKLAEESGRSSDQINIINLTRIENVPCGLVPADDCRSDQCLRCDLAYKQ
ncbi:hypothetical protein [Geoalkalibacter subterraneus]|uniref:Uncharacterized protein n=1 Tax=Geoalkalibacter subterraneus TaxID=483547 RepID=A0A0B5FJ45_9BACT|nr:hypothetical protein [Geoalkalibacter subterraneus]AJF08202.1 hypothetical protein GSUB_17080 [Geoalkalibacter subterraneus]